MDLKQLHQLKCELLKVYRYQGLTLQELLCEFYSHINEVINSTNGLIDIVDYLVGEGLSNEVATHLNQMLIDGTFDKIISNKVDELSSNLNNQFNEMKKIIESNISESNNLIENLKIYDSRFNNIDTKNIEQDTRLKDIEYRNKVQDVYINGFFNENKDGRLSVEGEGNDLKLEGSKEGLVEVERIVGNTFVNLCTNSRNHALQKDDLKQNTMTITTSYSLTVGKQYTLVLILKDVINVNNHFLWFKAYGNDIPVTLANGIQTISFIMGDSNNSNFTLRLQLADIQAGSKATVDSIMIFEGDLTTTPELIPTQHIEGLKSSFEENLVTQEMINEGLEDAENLGKYKVPINVIGENKFERTTNVYLNSPLLEGDEIVMKDGELCHYHKMGSIIFDGSNDEGWLPDNGVNTSSDFYCMFTTIIPKIQGSNGKVICDNLPFNYEKNFNIETTTRSGGGYFEFILKATNTTEFTTRLSELSPIVVYQLAEPWYEPIQADKLLLECANDSTLHIDSIVPVESVKASYTGNVPSVYAIEETGITNTGDISVTQTAVDFLLMSSMGESLMISFLNNVKGINNLGKYFASRIIKKALSYDDVINKYPQFKNDIDTILLNEGYEYFIK